MSKQSFKRVSVFSKGDYAEKDWESLLNELRSGWEIVSAVCDEVCINYILKSNDGEKK